MARRIALVLALWALCLPGCSGCGKTKPAEPPPDDGKPTVRLYLMSDIAGALEPCGCSKDQLGGLDHLAAFVRAEAEHAPRQLAIAAGPLLYIDPRLDEHAAQQDRWKAEAIADAMGPSGMGLDAWAPGYNDWAGGADALADNAAKSGAQMLVGGSAWFVASAGTSDQGGVKVGVVGVSTARDPAGKPPPGAKLPSEGAVAALVKERIAELRTQGARVLVVAAAMPRGAALRLIDDNPDLNVLLIGSEIGRGHANTAQPAPEIIGSTLVVQTANHAQTVAVVDVYLRGSDPAAKTGRVSLADAGGVARAAKVAEIGRRIHELEVRINGWEAGGATAPAKAGVDPADVAARRADLAKLRAERDALAAEQPPPPAGSYFRFAVREVRAELGKDAMVSARMLALYKQIDEHNKTALADLVPPPAGPDEASFVGVEACTTCHEEERKVWDATQHAHAYQTLADGFKEFNLECVSCHVTGYGKAGGSTVTHVDKLRDVQCEECHGAGSKHAKKPNAKGLIVRKPDPKGCVEACHHPPHVEGFDAAAKMELILGPGHGK